MLYRSDNVLNIIININIGFLAITYVSSSSPATTTIQDICLNAKLNDLRAKSPKRPGLVNY